MLLHQLPSWRDTVSACVSYIWGHLTKCPTPFAGMQPLFCGGVRPCCSHPSVHCPPVLCWTNCCRLQTDCSKTLHFVSMSEVWRFGPKSFLMTVSVQTSPDSPSCDVGLFCPGVSAEHQILKAGRQDVSSVCFIEFPRSNPESSVFNISCWFVPLLKSVNSISWNPSLKEDWKKDEEEEKREKNEEKRCLLLLCHNK